MWMKRHVNLGILGLITLGAAAAPAFAQQERVLHDTLWFTEELAYDTGSSNANCISSNFSLYDLEVCDDFAVPANFRVTQVTVASLSFFGSHPINGIDIGLFADLDGSPDNAPFYESLWEDSFSESWDDPIFGLPGVRTTAIGVSEVIPAGRWFIRIKPCHFTGSSDWYYIVRDFETNEDGDSHHRDGDNGEGSYDTLEWASAGELGYTAGDSAFRVIGVVGMPYLSLDGSCPGTITLTASGVTPGETIYFAAGLEEGETPVPDCPGLSVDIAGARLAGTATADENGNATFTGSAPEQFCGRVIVQAVSHSDCLKSNAISL